MNTIFKVLSNVKHNGDTFLKDTFISGQEFEFAGLVQSGVLKVIEGATTEEEAKQIDSEEASEKEEVEEEVAPTNTWGGKPDEEEATDTNVGTKPEDGDVTLAGEVYTGPMIKIKFIKDYEVLDEKNEKTGEILAEGTEQEVPEPVVAFLIEEGFAEKVTEEVVSGTQNSDGADGVNTQDAS